jgi:hypothetical protein
VQRRGGGPGSGHGHLPLPAARRRSDGARAPHNALAGPSPHGSQRACRLVACLLASSAACFVLAKLGLGGWIGLLGTWHDAHLHSIDHPDATDGAPTNSLLSDAWGSRARDPRTIGLQRGGLDSTWVGLAGGEEEHGGKRHAHPQHPSSAHATSLIRLPAPLRAPIHPSARITAPRPLVLLAFAAPRSLSSLSPSPSL